MPYDTSDKAGSDSMGFFKYEVIIFPNMEGGRTFVQAEQNCEDLSAPHTKSKRVRKTEFKLPPWIIANIHKITKASKAQLQELEAESARVAQDETLQKMAQDIRALKKEMKQMQIHLPSF